MTKNIKGQINAKIRDLLFKTEKSNLITADIVEQLIKDYPEVIEPEKDRLIRASLAHQVRQVVDSSKNSLQLELPGFDKIPNLPNLIKLRLGAKNGPKTILNLFDVTEEQLEQEITALKERRRSPSKHVKALDKLSGLIEKRKKELKLKPKVGRTLGDIFGITSKESASEK